MADLANVTLEDLVCDKNTNTVHGLELEADDEDREEPNNKRFKAKMFGTNVKYPRSEDYEFVESVREQSKRFWHINTTLKLIDLYEMNWCLWNSTTPEFKKKKLREKAIMNIVKAMNIDGFGAKEARDKLRCLRNTYTSELLKISKKESSENGEEEAYVPSLRWFSKMDSFLRPFVMLRTGATPTLNLPQMPVYQLEHNHTYANGAEESDPDASQSELQHDKFPREKQTAASFSEFVSENTSKQKLSSSIRNVEVALQQLKESTLDMYKDNNEFELFGQFVASQLKKLPEYEALTAMNHIQSYLIDRRMSALEGL